MVPLGFSSLENIISNFIHWEDKVFPLNKIQMMRCACSWLQTRIHRNVERRRTRNCPVKFHNNSCVSISVHLHNRFLSDTQFVMTTVIVISLITILNYILFPNINIVRQTPWIRLIQGVKNDRPLSFVKTLQKSSAIASCFESFGYPREFIWTHLCSVWTVRAFKGRFHSSS